MLDTKGTEKYWEEQTKKGDNPCHYHNYWQDKYAFKVRSEAFRPADFDGAQEIVDIGCGVGDYTLVIARLSGAHIVGYDFPFNIELARKRTADPRIEFRADPLPSYAVAEAMRKADVIVTTTVYVHLSEEARDSLLAYAAVMRPGSKVLLLEYIPDTVPEYQKNLLYKSIETLGEIEARFNGAGFDLHSVRHVNFLDSFLFFRIGKNAVAYYATLAAEKLLALAGYSRSKYKLLTFVKRGSTI